MPRVGKIAKLPPELRTWLHRTFVERAFGDIEAVTAELNELLAKHGVGERIGKSAVGEESQKVRRAQEAIKATTEATKLIAEASRDDGDTRSEASIALIQSEVFTLLMALQEAKDEMDPVERIKHLTKLAKSMSEMSRARVNQSRFRREVEAAAQAAADKVTKLARKGGADAATVNEIRRSVLGIVKRDAATA